MRKLNHSELLERRLKVEELEAVARHPITVILHNIRSLYNVGSFFRTCDSALVKELILCGYTPHPPRIEIEKTALGAVDTVPWRYYKTTQEAISYCKKNQMKVVAVELTDASRNYDSLTTSDFPIALIFGNELSGIDNEILELCDDSVSIPMYGVKHSLNVSVSAGIAIYDAVRVINIHNKNTFKF